MYVLYHKVGNNLTEVGRFNAQNDSEAVEIAESGYSKICEIKNHKIPYTRYWNTDDETVIDVGWHSSFFVLHPKISLTSVFFESSDAQSAEDAKDEALTIKDRDYMIFGDRNATVNTPGGVKNFDKMSLDTALWLVHHGFLDTNDVQNNSPTAGDFLVFMQKHDGFYANGYAVQERRSDCRVTITGISKSAEAGITTKDIGDFATAFQYADELDIGWDYLYCWYD